MAEWKNHDLEPVRKVDFVAKNLDSIESVRMCIRNPEQLQRTTKVKGFSDPDGHFGYVLTFFQETFNLYHYDERAAA